MITRCQVPWWKPAENPSRPVVAANRLRGCLLGGALADALAFAHEGRAPGSPPPLRVGSISDDTQLTLATCEAVISAKGEVKPEVVAEHFVRWHRQHGFVGIGAATAKAVRELSVGGHWALVGRKGQMAAGNGAAIRVAPLAFALDLGTRRGRQVLRDVCRITHHSDEAYVGALAIALTVQEAAGEWSGRAALLERLAAELPDTAVRDRLVDLADHEDATIADLAARFGSSGYVVESVPLAIHAFCSAAEGDYIDMVTQIVEAGGDCDSIASMAGQCFGALRGTRALPRDLLERLPSVVDQVCAQLVRELG